MPFVRSIPARPAMSAPLLVDPPPRRRPTIVPRVPTEPKSSKPPSKRGYKFPPVENQFVKGTSGNPRGRPKGAKGLKTLVRELLTQKVKVRTAAGLKNMTKMEAMLHKILEQALSGNLRALQSFVVLYQQAVPDDPVPVGGNTKPDTIADLNEHDRAMLDELRATLATELGEAK